jgi:glutamate dehydrogenase (NADP+)
MLAAKGQDLKGKKCLVSGSGNVAQYTVEKLLDLGAKPLTFSDSGGVIHDPDGITREKLAWVMDLKNVRRGRISEYKDKFSSAEYIPIEPSMDHNPLWDIPADCAFPSATQNEINGKDAKNLVKNGVKVIGEGANMPSTPDAIDTYLENDILYGLGKAANAGGVAVSALEMSQNSMRYAWTREEVDNKLKGIMQSIHDQAFNAAKEYGAEGNYVVGANVAGFLKVANSMMDQGLV